MELKISPSIGIARLGNSPDTFCLSPEKLGGLPYDSDEFGNMKSAVKHFKDDAGLIKRQGQRFRIFDMNENEITENSPNIESINWTVHLANKKAAWYQYSELEGNLLYGKDNSYNNRNVPLRNASAKDRKDLIIDPGPRNISGPRKSIGFDKDNVPENYPATYPNPSVKFGTPIKTLGELKTDDEGRLIVIGAFGHAGGDKPLTSYGGSDTWHDDIADGPVYCTVKFSDGSPDIHLQAWVIVGSPDFAPEIVNISTLSDTMFDVGVRNFDLVPEMYSNEKYNDDYIANFHRDILPIIQRIGNYQWVANVQSMSAFNSFIFDFSDPGETNRKNRETYFSYFRPPNNKANPSPNQSQEVLFKEENDNFIPMMPLNSGSNSVSNETIVKFLSLDQTQYFLLGQWAKGLFENSPNYQPFAIDQTTANSVGNCVGLPMCPGIEVTWSMQNPNVYEAPYLISDQAGIGGYNETGLNPNRDECEGGGCEPGDLTKRMACPWQADFFQCTIQYINFTDPEINKDNNTPKPPTYYSYWWPPQSPWDVITGELTAEGQSHSHLPAGQQMNYARGINSFVQMVEHWSALAFIKNNNAGTEGFPYFTETERNNELFSYKEVPVGTISGNDQDNETTIPVFYIEESMKKVAQKSQKAKKLVNYLESRAFNEIEVHEDGLGIPRSGTRSRR
ncbi:CTQ-dependent lysine 6-oxidase LodA [Membranihabitans maritimus]|uniref:CTQ-dependent lysine 6-oxidase LodA n=1 Tax=Membranihabitans maritimus TaxID=2904244 RepID=UPI001F172379|nr:CTQ-dependent lysine 6-oxidase LodA [Membranihabitans maritimus]